MDSTAISSTTNAPNAYQPVKPARQVTVATPAKPTNACTKAAALPIAHRQCGTRT
jgi:hypothetical protein